MTETPPPAHDFTPDPANPEWQGMEASGAFANCVCADCMERRLVDDDRMTYTAHDMADAWTQGYKSGLAAAEKRLAAAP